MEGGTFKGPFKGRIEEPDPEFSAQLAFNKSETGARGIPFAYWEGISALYIDCREIQKYLGVRNASDARKDIKNRIRSEIKNYPSAKAYMDARKDLPPLSPEGQVALERLEEISNEVKAMAKDFIDEKRLYELLGEVRNLVLGETKK